MASLIAEPSVIEVILANFIVPAIHGIIDRWESTPKCKEVLPVWAVAMFECATRYLQPQDKMIEEKIESVVSGFAPGCKPSRSSLPKKNGDIRVNDQCSLAQRLKVLM